MAILSTLTVNTTVLNPILAAARAASQPACPAPITAIIEISAKNGQGIGELEQTLKEMFFEGKISFNDEIYNTNVRQKQH